MKHHTLAAAVVLALAIARPAVADTSWHIWQSGTVGCELRSDVEQILNLPTTDDLRALLRELLMSGRCFLLAKGTEVVISSKGMSEDIVAVRRPDETAYLYVDRWAVQGPGGEPSE
jgi:hypothetical protein